MKTRSSPLRWVFARRVYGYSAGPAVMPTASHATATRSAMNALLMKYLALGMVALVMVCALGLAHSIQDRKKPGQQRMALLESKSMVASVALAASAAGRD